MIPIVFLKVSIQWFLFIVPLMIITPILSLLYQLNIHSFIILELTLLMATPVLFYLGAIVAVLTVGFKNNGFLLAITLLPLYIPVLIFSMVTVLKSQMNLAISADLEILAAFLFVILPIAPVIAAFALRIGIISEL